MGVSLREFPEGQLTLNVGGISPRAEVQGCVKSRGASRAPAFISLFFPTVDATWPASSRSCRHGAFLTVLVSFVSLS